VRSTIGSGEVRFHYVPAVSAGALVFVVDALGTGDALIASATSDEVTLVEGKAVPLTIALGMAPPDLGTDMPTDLATDMPKVSLQPGEPCAGDAQCKSGFCVDHVCCETKCAGACVACDLPGREGTCSPVTNNDAPSAGHPACGPDSPATCQLDGKCDGKGACRLWPLNTVCKESTCNAGTNLFIAESTCDGKGACITPAAATCAPFLCKDAKSCVQTCTQTAGQCAGTNVCTSGSCGPKEDGANCSGDGECKNGHCVDGVCCDQTCGETCRSCNQSASRGKCTLVPAGQDPRNTCPAGAGLDATCRPGGCSGTTTACALAATGTMCRAASCSADTATPAATCNASGSCAGPIAAPCSPYRCSGNACATSCGVDGDCASGNFCNASNRCEALRNPGASCTLAKQCKAGLSCADGVCCNSTCSRSCEACNLAGTMGTCTAIPAGLPRAGHPTCTNQGQSPCGGTCDGAGRDCTYSTGECGAPTCGCIEFAGVPDGCRQTTNVCAAGSCVTTTTMCKDMGHVRCNSTATACLPYCLNNTQCLGGWTCQQALAVMNNRCAP
jgi:hypothetical protein